MFSVYINKIWNQMHDTPTYCITDVIQIEYSQQGSSKKSQPKKAKKATHNFAYRAGSFCFY